MLKAKTLNTNTKTDFSKNMNPSGIRHKRHIMPLPYLADLANTTSLTEGADGPHVALIPGAKLGRVVVGWGVQGNAWMYISGGLQMVALTKQRNGKGDREWKNIHRAQRQYFNSTNKQHVRLALAGENDKSNQSWWPPLGKPWQVIPFCFCLIFLYAIRKWRKVHLVLLKHPINVWEWGKCKSGDD